MTAARRRTARAPLPGDAVHLTQVIHELRILREEVKGFPIPAHPSPVVRAMIYLEVGDNRQEREALAVKIIRASHGCAQIVKRGRGEPGEQIIKLADKLNLTSSLAADLLEAYVQS